MNERLPWIIAAVLGVVVVVLAVVLLTNDGDDTATTTSSSPTTSSTAPDTTTTEPDTTTTTTDPSTTTTTAPETTTTSSSPTTTVPPGAWADVPLVVADFGALGWWDGASWVQVETGTALPVTGGEDYRVARLGVEAITTGGAPTVVCEPLENPAVPLDDPSLLGEFPGPFGVAVSAPWALTPHAVEEQTDDGSYAGFAADLLATRGLDVAEPIIEQLLRIDLEGDGVDEALVVAEDIADPGLLAEVGDYSIVFLRKVVDGEVQTAVIADSVVAEVAEGETPFVLSFGIGAVADLNGDGRMEIVLSSAYYEGAGVEVWEYVNDDLGPVRVIGTGCGA